MRSISLPGRTISCEAGKPLLAAILNLSTDSFSGDGAEDWKVRADRLLAAGVRWIDAGAESTRPGAVFVPTMLEIALLIPALSYLRSQSKDLILSADTRKACVARAAAEAGADVINDVSGLADPEMAQTVAEQNVSYVLVHSRGTPATMQDPENLVYKDVTGDVCTFFENRLKRLERAGVARSRILLDPGIGFAKTTEQNLELIRAASVFHKRFDLPLFYGVSRKRFIGELTGEAESSARDAGTLGALLYLADQGVEVLRVHNVKSAWDALCVYDAIKTESCRKGK